MPFKVNQDRGHHIPKQQHRVTNWAAYDIALRVVERYWRRMLCSRSWAGRRLTWDAFNRIKERTPLLTPKLRLPYRELQALAVL